MRALSAAHLFLIGRDPRHPPFRVSYRIPCGLRSPRIQLSLVYGSQLDVPTTIDLRRTWCSVYSWTLPRPADQPSESQHEHSRHETTCTYDNRHSARRVATRRHAHALNRLAAGGRLSATAHTCAPAHLDTGIATLDLQNFVTRPYLLLPGRPSGRRGTRRAAPQRHGRPLEMLAVGKWLPLAR